MGKNSRPHKEGQERCLGDSKTESLSRFRQNLEELSAVLESDYKVYLNPKIISRMKDLLEGKSYDVI